MFKNDLYITEISLQDFLQLDIALRRLDMDKSDADKHSYHTIEEKASDFVKRNLDYYETKGNVLVATFKGQDEDGLLYIKYYTAGVQNYVIYPGCAGAYRKRDKMTFKFNGEDLCLPMSILDKIYLVHL